MDQPRDRSGEKDRSDDSHTFLEVWIDRAPDKRDMLDDSWTDIQI